MEHKDQTSVTPAPVSTSSTSMDNIPIWRFVMITFSLCMALFLALMDTSIVSTAIFTIADEFGSIANTTWLILAYTLSYLGFAVTITRLADVVGRQYIVIASYVIFIAMSIGCGFASSVKSLIALRTIQGIGGAGLYSMCLVILPEISPLKVLPFISPLLGLLVGMAGILGPVLGGIISEHNWRWIFWLNGPVGFLSLVIFVIAWPRHAHGFELSKHRFRDIDFLGCLLLLAASVLFVLAFHEGSTGEWSSAVTVCTMLFGCLSGVALFIWEVFIWRRYREAIAMIMPARVFTNRVVVAGILNTLFTGVTLFVVIFDVPLRSQIVNLDNSTQAGLRLLPYLASVAVGTMLGGSFSAKSNRIFETMVAASALIIVGDVLLSTLPWSIATPARIYGYQVIAGIGTGMTLACTTVLVPLEVDFRDYAVAQGIVGQVRLFGGSIGIAASSAIFNTQLRRKLSGILTSAQISGLQTSYRTVLSTLNTDQLLAIRDVYASSFDETLRMCAYFAAAGLVVAFFTWQRNPPSIAQRKTEMIAAMEDLHRRQAEQAASKQAG